eukprot:CAMPEP_0169206834 /NCGR_PEP_ID=MMETSP1016-20121227/13256_1 /TAXON_ID=342587 /ORGANISM="Karlodinium micrum, Strain CCMP2283" /LENGTH=421 /DNA_ID=CAMNT_0009284061 /DNA_START=45 /DNA_END=1310 /DNA_ORIENTATION=-
MAPRVATKAKPGTADSKSTTSEAISLRTEDASKKRGRDWGEDLPQPGTSAESIIRAGFIRFEAAKQEATPFRDFIISLDMLGKTTLGIDVDWADGRTLLVKSVQSGAISDWNFERGPEKALRPGDRIVAVNGMSGERIGAVALVQECKGKSRVELQIRTQRPHHHRPVSQPPKPEATEVAKAQSQSSPPKRPNGSLYSFLPAPDPENDRSAGSRAKGSDPFSEPVAAETPRLAIFLDIDGVLRRCEGRNVISLEGEVLPLHLLSRKFEAEAVRALRYLIHRTGAGIVLSSEWRRDKALREEVAATLRTAGIPPMRGVTAVLEPREEVAIGPPNSVERESGPATMRLRWAERRAREISLFLRERPEIQRWVALDDLDLSMADDKSLRLAETLWMGPGLVLVEAETAFTMSDARRAVELLLKS